VLNTIRVLINHSLKSGLPVFASLCHFAAFSRLPFLPARLTENWPVRRGFERHFTGSAAFGANCFEVPLFLLAVVGVFEESVLLQPRPSRLRVAEHVGVSFQPSHHVEEAFCPFFFAFCEWFVAEVPNLVKIRDFHEPLRFADHFDALHFFFAVDFAQLLYCNVEYAALADVNLLFRLNLQLGEQIGHDSQGFLQVLLGAEEFRLVEPHVDEVVLELVGFFAVGAYDYAGE
jgi:hypothetical protein